MTMPAASHPPVFVDGFGARHVLRDPDSGDLLEHLVFGAELVEAPGFLVALGERVARLAAFRNACCARIGHLEALAPGGVALVSEFTEGWRLSQLLHITERERVPVEVGVVFGVIRQLLPAVALLSQHARDVAHGALGPERLIVTPQGRLVITEHVLGSAIESLQYGRERLWLDFRVGTPPAVGLPRMGPRTDVTQIGLVVLALVLGRGLRDEEFPGELEWLVAGACGRLADAGHHALARAVGEWLGRALQLEPASSFPTTFAAQASLERVLSDHRDHLASSSSVQMLLTSLAPMLPPVVPARAEAPAAEEVVAITPAPVVHVALTEDEASEAPGLSLEPNAAHEPVGVPAMEPAGGTDAAPAVQPEAVAPSVRVRVSAPQVRRLLLALAAVACIALIEAAILMVVWTRAPAAVGSDDGELVVQSRPVAARVSIDGEDRGVTPLTVRLPAGAHVLQISVGGAEPRVIPLAIQPGVQTAQYIELLNVPTTGVLEVRSDPARARVSVDGRDYGVTPVTIRDLPPGEREVVLERGAQRLVQRVRVEPGTTAQLVVPLS
jgi:hypothetical protein